jgi:trimeric autotransporter adhesin
MRNFKLRNLIMLSGISALADPSSAAQPTDSVVSDAKGNTAMGGSALLELSGTCSGYQCSWNTAAGFDALGALTTAHSNSAFGTQALGMNTTGLYNTAVGSYALLRTNPVGALTIKNANGNTGVGSGAMAFNTTGYYNTAVGAYALLRATAGIDNTAVGAYALISASGSYNTATGSYALHSPNASVATNTGSNNTASGFKSMVSNTIGSNNTAFGMYALEANSIGNGNAAQGYEALHSNTVGNRNTAIGNFALLNNLGGSYNTAVGYDAGGKQTTGTDDIYIANTGISGESHTLRLGTQGTLGTEGSGIVYTYVAGVADQTVTGSQVYISASGQLGVLTSSERFKTDITPMPAPSQKLGELRPVTFHYKTDPTGVLQYGLIAEEVAKVYPELVIHDESGKIQGVRYEELAPMLLKESQEQRAVIERQQAIIKTQSSRMDEMARQLASLNDREQELRTALEEIKSLKEVVAQR